jgi:antitoxin VapB
LSVRREMICEQEQGGIDGWFWTRHDRVGLAQALVYPGRRLCLPRSPGLSLNIKNPEAHELVKELAGLTGETMTEAVIVAVRERLERLRSREDHARERARMIREMGREIARRLPPEVLTMDVDAYLYDENGLPR